MLYGKLSTRSYDLPPAGAHSGALVGAISLGSHWESFEGKEARKTGKIQLVWEILIEVDGRDSQVHVGQTFNVPLDRHGQPSFGPRAKLKEFLESWIGKPYQRTDRISPVPMIGQPCLVTVQHRTTKGGNDFALVTACGPLPKGMSPLTPRVIPVIYDAASKELPPNERWIPFVYGKSVSEVVKSSLEHGGDGGWSKLPASATATAQPGPENAHRTKIADPPAPPTMPQEEPPIVPVVPQEEPPF
jgi:hypothetical protein